MNATRKRNKKGYQFAELGPALIIIFIVVLFPMLDLLYLSLAFASGWYCNHLVVREVACRDPLSANAAQQAATQAWSDTGLAKFIGAKTTDVSNTISWIGGSPGSTPPPSSVSVATIVNVQPFLPIPFFMKIQGLNEPVKFSYAAERPQEEKGIQ
ncbi:MAG TPA: hypothetical protein V6C76_08200 [Drouetiella sp.]